eukprot:4255915-Prymnesium_polylepis.2
MFQQLCKLYQDGCVGPFASAYTTAQMRFFQQLLLAFKVPEIQRQTRRALRAGKCVVIGLQSTGESAVKAAFERDRRRGSLVSAAREAAEGLLGTLGRKRFAQNGMYTAFRAQVVAQLDALELPPAALDELVNYFGAGNVAEMTGRHHRLVRSSAGTYKLATRAERA